MERGRQQRYTGTTWWPDVLGLLAVASLLVVTSLWVAHGGVQDLGEDIPSGLTSAGRLTGLISADLLLIQLFLIARVPWVENTLGRDHIIEWHRWIGFTSFNLMMAHFVLIIVGYAGMSDTSIAKQTWDLAKDYPGMLLAFVALALFVLVTVTSIRAARRRLRYESWHLLHLYAYLGAGLALPHQVWTGADFLSSPVASIYWWTIYAISVGAVLIFRLGLPIWRTVRHRLEVSHVVTEGPGVVSVYLRGRRLDQLHARAGQFFVWRFLDGPGWSRGNPYSLSSVVRSDQLRITVKDLGDGSRRLAQVRPGTRALIEGPYGALTGAVRRNSRLVMIACGIGVTPLRALLEELPYAPGEAVLLYRVRTLDEAVFRAELDGLIAERGVRVHYLCGRRDTRGSWLPADTPDDVFASMTPEIVDSDVYICGPSAWAGHVIAAVRAVGVTSERIHAERFGW